MLYAVAALRIGVIADVVRVEAVHEAERAVVDREAEDRHVVGVHHAVAEADGLPVRHQVGGAQRDFRQQREIRIVGFAAMRIEAVDDVIGERASILPRDRSSRNARSEPKRTKLGDTRVTTADVSMVSRRTRQVGADDAQRARRRDAEVMHRFRAQEFADRRAQNRASVAHARIRRPARALQLQFERARRRASISPSPIARPSPSWPAHTPN